MARPYGSKNLTIVDPPYEMDLGDGVLTLDVDIEKTKIDKKDVLVGHFTLTVTDSAKKKVSIKFDAADLENFKTVITIASRFITKKEKELQRIQNQMAQLEERLSFLKR